MILKRGDSGPQVKEAQEWLCYNGQRTMIDGDFGPATEYSVKHFQVLKGLTPSGVIDDKTISALLFNFNKVSHMEPFHDEILLQNAIILVAQRHFMVAPVEIGGENMGPWVRFYTGGHEGKEWPWCAGFVSTIIYQAYEACQLLPPTKFKFTLSCDEMARYAQKMGTFSKTPESGSIFLVRSKNNPNDWIHTGIVLSSSKEVVFTVEGNTNDDGSREGYGVFHRTRAIKSLDFINLE